LATIHQRYRRTDRQTDGRISYGIGLDLTVGQKRHYTYMQLFLTNNKRLIMLGPKILRAYTEFEF